MTGPLFSTRVVSFVALAAASACSSGGRSGAAETAGGRDSGEGGAGGQLGQAGQTGPAGQAGVGVGPGAAGGGGAKMSGGGGSDASGGRDGGAAGASGDAGAGGTASAGGSGGGSVGGTGGAVAGHIYASPSGTGAACSSAAPCSITQAQTTARSGLSGGQGDLVIELADGTYRLPAPLVLTAADSGPSGHPVVWQAASGAHPVISGAQRVTGWAMSDATKGIWKAAVPGAFATRQLFVDGKIATRARQTITRSTLTFSDTGFASSGTTATVLNGLAHPEKSELHAVGSFTDRYSPVQAISNGVATMVQPAWKNNNWGYDTIKSSFRASTVWIENALELLDQAGEWFLDTTAGALYYKPATGQDLTTSDVELPQLEALVVVAGASYDQPAHDITFRGLTFSHTSWLGPNSTDGYANQQTGAFIHGGDYPEFEATRPKWWQMPAAVQVSAANNITFDRDRFVALGEVGLGIGNDDNAHLEGLGLGADTISVTGCVFTQIAAGAIAIGGIQENAHHPSNPKMTNQNMIVSDNLIHDVGIDYRDAGGILFTYTKNVVVSHNELYNLPYSGICLGYGWGANDAGGSDDYASRGLYKYQARYTTATTAQNNRIEANYLHDGTQLMNDAGCLYNLSANPMTVITTNYCKGPWPNTNGLYEDEGSRYLSITKNIVTGFGTWGTANANASNNTGDLTVTNNWVSGTASFGGKNNMVAGNTTVNGALPADAQTVATAAGLEPSYADLKTTP